MRILKTKWFVRYARKEKITDSQLRNTILDLQNGLIDCDYQDGVIKQRIGRSGQGKSGGYRSIILYHFDDYCFFVFCYSKNEKSDLTNKEIKSFKDLSREYLKLSEIQIQELIALNELTEVL
jgi:hypothetical protein